MNNLPLQPLVWTQSALTHTAESPLHSYIIRYDELEGAYLVDYYERMTGEHGDKFCKSVDDAKHWIATDHYPSKMQPYVKPTPAKVYELTYDCGDSYSTIFMTLDKQLAVDFIESVKKHDDQFVCDTSYDEYEVETIHDLYNDNHPLAPYKDKIFDAIYEDSFSEWALSYVGSSFVSSLGIIEHELFSAMQNNKGE